MYTLKVTNLGKPTEESEFATEQVALDWKQHLFDINYVNEDTVFEIVATSAPIPDISPRQITTALLSMGITEEMVDTAIGTLTSPNKELGMIAWKKSGVFVRSEPAVAMIGALLGLNSTQLDQLWIAARLL